MEFTYTEKLACLWTLMSLAECDGPRTYEENGLLASVCGNFGITMAEVAMGIINEVGMFMSQSKAEETIKPMPFSKKKVLENAMIEIMELDPVNENKLNCWWGMQMAFDLPEWISRKNEK